MSADERKARFEQRALSYSVDYMLRFDLDYFEPQEITARAQAERQNVADCVQFRDWCRDEFEGWESPEAAEAVREAEDDLEWAYARLQEWEI